MNLRKMASEGRPQQVFPTSSKRQSKGSSPIRESLQQNSTFLGDNLINFDINSYPFLNQPPTTAKVFRSTVNLKASSQQLRKLMRLNHPNLINLQKITRGHGKEASLNKQHDIYYSFYYDYVPFSLKYVAMYQDNSNNILKKINQINLQKILSNLSEYLVRAGVNYLFALGDIGVTKDGEIKIFFSPIHLNNDKEILEKNQITTSINKITAWWETTLASNTSLNPKSSNIILPSEIGLEDEASIDYLTKDNQELFVDKETSQLMGEQYDQSREYNQYRNSNAKESMVKNSTLKFSNNSLKSDLSSLSVSQMNKMKKIDQQIKYIRQRLKDKRQQHKTSDSFLDKKEKEKIRKEANIMAQSDRIQKKDIKEDKNKAEGSNVIEKIQQNINCINIYTQAKDTTQNASHTKIKKMTSQPIYSFHIAPENAKQKSKPPQQVIVHHPSFQPEDFPNSEGASSVDTYEMELQAEIEPAKAVQRNSALVCQREISEKNYRPSHQNQLMSEKKNQVANKHVTQSAGPLQFKNFVNKYIKPQFLAKKSNIYEDPMEYESETSKSISKKKKIINDLYENGKSVNSQTQKSSSLNHNPQESDCKKKDIFQQANYNHEAFLKGGYNRTSSEIKLMPIRDISTEKNDNQMSRKPNDSKIGQRIKLVLEKTKNAIALLNRVKNCKSPPVSQQKIQNSSHNY